MARKILLADDSVTAQNMGRKILADAGYEVITVNNGSAALKKIAEIKPDLIVLDVYMPGYSGLEVCQRVKEAAQTSRIPVLLTVGKLEPFKPEEARRVRAEGFIIKPFEASELLSALSKLEDKIVPRGDAAKSGRFARANAAIEEGSWDKDAGADEDSGWKSRIAFPVKKKKSEEEDADSREIYNPMNKDLRTVVDQEAAKAHARTAEKSRAEKADDDRVDLSALAVKGLPADVTSEEIAALAAAAAQVKSKIAEATLNAEASTSNSAVEVAAPAEVKVEKAIAQVTLAGEAAVAPEAASAPAIAPVVTVPDQVISTATTEQATVAAAPAMGAAEMPETNAGAQPVNERGLQNRAFHDAQHDSQHDTAHDTAPQDPSSQHVKQDAADEPVTMAVAAASASEGRSRWMAIPVALASEESAISLEQEMQKELEMGKALEMQKTHAALAAAEMNAESMPSVEEAPASVTIPQLDAVAAPIESLKDEPAAVVSLVEAEPSLAVNPSDAFPAVAHFSAKPFETVAAGNGRVAVSHAEPAEIAAPTSQSTPEPELGTGDTSVSIPAGEPAVEPISATAPEISEPMPAVAKAEIGEQKASEDEPVISQPVPLLAEESSTKVKIENEVEAHVPPTESSTNEFQAVKLAGAEPVAIEPQAGAPSTPVAISDPSSESDSVAEEFSAKATASAKLHEPSGGEMGKKESEIAATTAAAWASWRQIRETGDPHGKAARSAKAGKAGVEEDVDDEPRDAAAMAVAAGAENRPAEADEEEKADPEEIASIVDSVLAQMRPKIVEEISRKMGKKK